MRLALFLSGLLLIGCPASWAADSFSDEAAPTPIEENLGPASDKAPPVQESTATPDKPLTSDEKSPKTDDAAAGKPRRAKHSGKEGSLFGKHKPGQSKDQDDKNKVLDLSDLSPGRYFYKLPNSLQRYLYLVPDPNNPDQDPTALPANKLPDEYLPLVMKKYKSPQKIPTRAPSDAPGLPADSGPAVPDFAATPPTVKPTETIPAPSADPTITIPEAKTEPVGQNPTTEASALPSGQGNTEELKTSEPQALPSESKTVQEPKTPKEPKPRKEPKASREEKASSESSEDKASKWLSKPFEAGHAAKKGFGKGLGAIGKPFGHLNKVLFGPSD